MDHEENSNSESDNFQLKSSSGNNKQKPKRGRPPKYDPTLGMTPEYTASNTGGRRNTANSGSNNTNSNPHQLISGGGDSREGYSDSQDDYYDDLEKEEIAQAQFLSQQQMQTSQFENVDMSKSRH